MGDNTTRPGNRPVRPGGNRPRFGAMRGDAVPNLDQGGQDDTAQDGTGQDDTAQDTGQVQQPQQVAPNTTPNVGPNNRPRRPGMSRPQFGAMRHGKVPGQQPDDQDGSGSEDSDQDGGVPPSNVTLPPLPQVPQQQPPIVQQQPPPVQVLPPLPQVPQQQPPNPPPLPVQPPRPSPTPVVPQNEQIGQNQVGKLSSGDMGKLTDGQRQWSDNVLKALKLKSKGSQARLLAGALATTEQLRQANSPDLQRAQALLKTVQKAGDPPWKDARQAMAAADAAMHLDLLSIPPGNRQLAPFGGGGVNTTFTVDRLDADGVTRHAFLCKPATPPRTDALLPNKVGGIPNGGEVMREGLASRAAQTFAAQTGIDIKMPESHVVSLPATSIPGGNVGDPDVTCSIQEFGPGLKPLKELTEDEKRNFTSESIAALAVFDLMTLNCDRHSGNIMSDGQGGMLPIDHGACFVQSDIDQNNADVGKIRLGETMTPGHNALLRLPGAFDPMPPEMVKKLKSMESSSYRKALEKDREDIGKVHPGMADTVSDEALDWAAKAARFAKLAARSNPPLSAGAMQLAFGANSAKLLDAPDFDAAANAVIAEAAPHNDTVKAVCTYDDAEYAELRRKVVAKGWRVQERGGSPSDNPTLSDPLMMLSILENDIPRGNTAQARKDADDRAHAQIPNPNTMKARLLALRLDLINKYIALMPANERAAQTLALNNLVGTPDQRIASSEPIKLATRVAAVDNQLDRLNQKLAAGTSPTLYQVVNAQDALAKDDPIAMALNLDLLP